MSAPDFESLLRPPSVPTPEELAKMEAQRAQEETKRQLLQNIGERNSDVSGTPVEQRFWPEDAQLCLNFLAFMAERGYPGSSRLEYPLSFMAERDFPGISRTEHPSSPDSVRGYCIGKVTMTDIDGSLLRTWAPGGLPQYEYRSKSTDMYLTDVYLCEDGRLRVTGVRMKSYIAKLGSAPIFSPDGVNVEWNEIKFGHRSVDVGEIPGYWESVSYQDFGVGNGDNPDTSYRRVGGGWVPARRRYEHVPLTLQEKLMSIAAEHTDYQLPEA